MKTSKSRSQDENRSQLRNEDPITREPGAHPVGAGTGAVVGGATVGAAAGSLAGPIGTVAGAIVGGVAGAYAGKAIAENINPTVESDYWRKSYKTRPYYTDEYSYDDYEPAYRLGWESYDDEDGNWESREADLKKKWDGDTWDNEGGATGISWEMARLAAKDAYERLASRTDDASCDADTDECRAKPR